MKINLFFSKKTFSLYIIFSLLSICFAQESYKSSFCTTAKYYSDIVEKISFSIPNEKSFLEECKLQFLDKNNNDMICYEMTVKLKKEKQDYVIKNFPTSRIGGISKELFESYLNKEYLWLIHLKVIFPDGSENVYNDNYLLIGAMFYNKYPKDYGEYKWEQRGEIEYQENGYSYVLPYGYRENTFFEHRLFDEQEKYGKSFCSVDSPFVIRWGKPFFKSSADFIDSTEYFSIGSFELSDLDNVNKISNDKNVENDIQRQLLTVLKDLFPWYTRVKFENIMINENMCKKYSVRDKCKFIIEIYFFQKGDFIVYALMRAKNKKSVLQESKMSILESIEIK